MRLFKLLVIAIVIGSIYFYARQHSSESNHWQNLAVAPGISIQFPQQPVSKSFQKEIANLGKTKLTTYQTAHNKHLYVMLVTDPLPKSIRHKKLNALEDSVHAMNDTGGLTITHKQAFMFRSHPGIEYKATNDKGAVLWCRTIIKENQLISIIYGDSSTNIDNQQRDTFFNSLEL